MLSMFDGAIRNVISAWAGTQSELDSLLQRRIDGLLAKLRVNLAVIGALGATSILIALLTHRHIVGSLKRFEAVANAVRETKDYGLRVDLRSRDEIGRLAEAFNDMPCRWSPWWRPGTFVFSLMRLLLVSRGFSFRHRRWRHLALSCVVSKFAAD